jgi:hypothetical protein
MSFIVVVGKWLTIARFICRFEAQPQRRSLFSIIRALGSRWHGNVPPLPERFCYVRSDGRAQRLLRTRPVMRAAACFHADQARRQIGEECHHMAARELLFETRFLMRIYLMDLAHVFCQIDANRRKLLDGRSFRISSC